MVTRVERSSPLGRVLATGLRHEFESRDMIKDAMEETGRAVAHDLERFLPSVGRKRSTSCATARPVSSMASLIMSRDSNSCRSPVARTRPSG